MQTGKYTGVSLSNLPLVSSLQFQILEKERDEANQKLFEIEHGKIWKFNTALAKTPCDGPLLHGILQFKISYTL